MRRLLSVLPFVLVACGTSSGDSSGLDQPCGPDATADTGTLTDSGSGFDVPADTPLPDAAACEPPDVLVLLDRTLTMHKRPDGTTPTNTVDGRKESKFYQAVEAIKALTKNYDLQMRFGLAMFPRERDGCVTLETITGGTSATNTSCEEAEIRSVPGLGVASGFGAILDAEKTRLCISTPTGAAVISSGQFLAKIHEAKRQQYLLMVTDGADFDASCPTPDPIAEVAKLAKTGVKSFFIGFFGTASSGGTNPQVMNKLACAGRTAIDFATKCKDDGSGNYVPVDPASSAPLYLEAKDAAGLAKSLESVAASLACRTCLK